MASARPPGGGGSTPTARIGIDLSQLRGAANVARQAGQATAREISQAFRVVQNEQRVALEQARQTTAVLRAQQTQISATVRAESSVRTTAARAEAQAQQQTARAAAATQIEEQRRLTAAFRSELRTREAQQRASLRASAVGRGGGFAGGVAGAALGALGGPVGAIAGAAAGGALPAAVGLAVVEGGRQAVQASQLATAFDRQSLAAKNLAGSQARLNELLAAYTRASGGAADKATALSNVTRLQAVGFGDNAEEVERFTTAVRGSSIAMGKLQDEISQEVQLAISNQSFRRLDQIGLGISEVNDRIDELRANNKGLTREAAFEEAVIGLLIQKFGGLATSVEGQATGVEQLTRAWKDLRLEIGQVSEGPVSAIGRGMALFIDIQTARLRAWTAELDVYIKLLRQMGITGPGLTSTERTFVGGAASRDIARHRTTGAGRSVAPAFDEDQTAIIVERFQALQQVERQANLDILATTRQYNQQRASTIANYEKQIAREAEDFGRQRADAERKHALAILDVAQDSARQRVKWESDLARTIDQARADSAERQADARADANERIAELEEDYQKNRQRAAADHRDKIMDAAARLDAVAVREEQRNFARQSQDAKEAHDKQRSDLQEQLQERIDEENKSLARSIAQQQEAHARQLAEQAENDRLRIEEMKAAFEAQKAQEDEERGIRLERQAEDHAAQLAEMGIQHGARIQQIKDHAADERRQIDDEHQQRLADVGIQTDAWIKQQELLVNAAIASHKRFWQALQNPAQIGPLPQNRFITPGGFPSLSMGGTLPPPVAPVGASNSTSSTRTSSVVVQTGAIQISVPPGMNENWVANIFYRELLEFFGDRPQ